MWLPWSSMYRLSLAPGESNAVPVIELADGINQEIITVILQTG